VVHGEGWEVRIMQSRFMDGSVDPDDAGEVAAEAYLKLDSETHEAFIAATRAAVARLQRSRPS
jgi:hypothetical protein